MVIRDRRFWPRVCACWRCWFGTKTNAPSRPARGQTTATPRSGAARDDRDPCQTDQADTDVQKSMFRLRMSVPGRSNVHQSLRCQNLWLGCPASVAAPGDGRTPPGFPADCEQIGLLRHSIVKVVLMSLV